MDFDLIAYFVYSAIHRGRREGFGRELGSIANALRVERGDVRRSFVSNEFLGRVKDKGWPEELSFLFDDRWRQLYTDVGDYRERLIGSFGENIPQFLT